MQQQQPGGGERRGGERDLRGAAHDVDRDRERRRITEQQGQNKDTRNRLFGFVPGPDKRSADLRQSRQRRREPDGGGSEEEHSQ